MREDGYLLLRNLLDGARLEQLAEDIASAMQDLGWLGEGAPAVMAPALGPYCDYGSVEFGRGYAELQRMEAFHRVAFEPALRRVMTTFVGDDVFVHPMKVGRLIWPASLGHHLGLRAHQDYLVLRTQDMFVTWIPFTDCDRELGGLAIKRGAQNQGVLEPADVDDSDPEWVTADYRAGDVLVFHCLSTHAALPNRTGHMRFSGDFRWQPADVPVPRGVLVYPHEYPRVPDNAELSRDWQSTEWISYPDGLTIIENPGSGDITEIPPSRFVNVPAKPPAYRGVAAPRY